MVLVLFLLGICSGCAEKKQVFAPEPAVGYYPLKVGNFWEYRDGSDWYEYYLKKEIVDLCLIQGGIPAYKIRYVRTRAIFQDTFEYEIERITYEVLIDNEVRELYDLNDTSNYEIVLRFPIKVGDSWQKPPEYTDSMVVISGFYDCVTAIEDVITLAGEFEDCYKIEKTFLGGDAGFFIEERWFSPHVGFVKHSNGTFPFEYSLVDYKIIR